MNPILLLLVLLVMAWFAAGSIWNVRKGNAAMRWMQGGLPLLGERTTVRWLGTTSVELGIQQAKAPFTQLSLVIFLQPRDVPWLWSLARWSGRRDTLIIRGCLRDSPRRELEVIDRHSWSGRDAMRGKSDQRWSDREEGTGTSGFLVMRHDSDAGLVNAILKLASGAGMAVRRLSLQPSTPHLQLHVDLPMPTADAEGFFQTIRSIGERVAQ
jgi:hypothetical protein